MPIVPGVLQIEMIAQMAGKCMAMKNPAVLPVLGSVKSAKFYQNIKPGDQCIISIEVKKISRAYGIASGIITVNDQKMAAAEILFGLIDRKNLSSESFDEVSQEFLSRQQHVPTQSVESSL